MSAAVLPRRLASLGKNSQPKTLHEQHATPERCAYCPWLTQVGHWAHPLQELYRIKGRTALKPVAICVSDVKVGIYPIPSSLEKETLKGGPRC
jgi:hypothetical protein